MVSYLSEIVLKLKALEYSFVLTQVTFSKKKLFYPVEQVERASLSQIFAKMQSVIVSSKHWRRSDSVTRLIIGEFLSL